MKTIKCGFKTNKNILVTQAGVPCVRTGNGVITTCTIVPRFRSDESVLAIDRSSESRIVSNIGVRYAR